MHEMKTILILEDNEERIAAFKNAESVTVEKAGHWVHHDRLDEFLKIVHRFLGV